MKRLFYIWSLIIGLCFQASMNCNAQYITLPDANFANFIAANYPTAVNGSLQLDTNVAKTITGTFNAAQKNLSDVTGIEYFININRLYLSGNKLTFLPDLSRLTQLIRLHVDTNKLTTLPDLQAMTSLQYLWCHYNKITSLPSMANMTSVQSFFCQRNLLTSLPDITGMSSLNHFICSDNLITALPADMSSLISLNRLLCTNNNLTSVDLTSIPNVKEVHLRNNNLSNFPNITGMTQLTELHLDGNNFVVLPDLSSFTNLTNVRLENNNLTFEDLLPLASLPGFSGFAIAPQKLVGNKDTTLVKEKNTFIYSTLVDLLVGSNTYTWFKDGVQIGTSSTPSFSIPSVKLSDVGFYTFQINNSTPFFTTLILTSQPMKLEVTPCMDLSQFHYTSHQENCQSPIIITIDENSIQNVVPPLSYDLKNVLNNSTNTYTSPSISFKNSGLYELTVNDASNCSASLSYKLELEKKPGCDLVIYPDLEGLTGSYFLNHQGKASVYNTGGQKIRDLILPAYWDGKDQQGRIVDSGLYMIIVNEQINISISVMRTQ
jgi:hypothetical protein